jgi:hypothetical protein
MQPAQALPVKFTHFADGRPATAAQPSAIGATDPQDIL